METFSKSSAVVAAVVVAATAWLWRMMNWLWFKPKQLENRLRNQGFDGRPYRFPNGDLKEAVEMLKEAKSRQLDVSDDAALCVLPFHYHTVEKYGKKSFTWFGPVPRVHIMNPEHIKEVFAKVYEYPKMRSNPLRRLLVGGVASYNGEKWTHHRRILNPAFHQEKLKGSYIFAPAKHNQIRCSRRVSAPSSVIDFRGDFSSALLGSSYSGSSVVQRRRFLGCGDGEEGGVLSKLMVPAFYRSCKDIVDEWEKVVKSEGMISSCELDVWPYLQDMTCDVISRTAFGSSYKEGARIFELITEMGTFIVQIAQQIYIPGWRFVPTKANTRMKQVHKEIQELMEGIINKREKAMRMGMDDVANNDLLGVLMESNNKDGNMTVEEVIEECKLFYLAGQETTSSLLVWTMILLSKYPAWQERARQEVLHVFGTKHGIDSTTLDSGSLSQLKTMTMILNEVLRLYPPVTQLIRIIERDTELGDFILPAGTQVALPAILIHKDPEIWGKDAGEFNPERFSDGVSKATKNHNQQGAYFFPFSGGPRICIGQSFALMEAKMALAIILKRFSFELSPSYVHAPSAEAVTLRPQFGARLILHKL
ncbi:unnamed protein product [Linum tenue]|uniref:Cytochrome P450 n=1 Tax=Linum tenue TaxID=586396 RepID=A0AAV0JIG0_9ROSI|nr:unnamed protein product [Linum tenue]